jgi:hypothetical protein
MYCRSIRYPRAVEKPERVNETLGKGFVLTFFYCHVPLIGRSSVIILRLKFRASFFLLPRSTIHVLNSYAFPSRLATHRYILLICVTSYNKRLRLYRLLEHRSYRTGITEISLSRITLGSAAILVPRFGNTYENCIRLLPSFPY